MHPSWLPASTVPVTVVCGRPGSGKTTYVGQHAQPSELVIDIDVIASKVFSVAMYEATKPQAMGAVRVRNAMLAGLAKTHSYTAAWLIVGAGSAAGREFWRAKYSNLVVMDVAADECVRRIEADPLRSAAARARHIAAVHDWT